ncbi:MAG: hypothetical protein JWP48_2949 [Actinoallomurus sp.]|jgi:hypothetical protein|nr:hypothetical protein [Actinoallomurus sp.]
MTLPVRRETGRPVTGGSDGTGVGTGAGLCVVVGQGLGTAVCFTVPEGDGVGVLEADLAQKTFCLAPGRSHR